METSDFTVEERLRLMCLEKAIQATGAGPHFPVQETSVLTTVAESLYAFIKKVDS